MSTRRQTLLAEANELIEAINRNIQEAEEDEFPNVSAIEKLYGRKLAAFRQKANIVLATQKNSARLLDSPEWVNLAEKLASCIADCDHCSAVIMPLLNAQAQSKAE